MGGPSLELGVAQPSVSEAVAPHHADSLPSLVAKELASAEAVSAALVAAPVPPGCSEPSCLPEAGSAAYLVRSQLTAVEQDYDVRLEVIDRKSGAVVASAAGSCEVCTEVEVGEMITRTAARLAEPLAGLLSQSAIIVVEGAPDGAAVAIDGQAVGSSPYSGQVEAGTHQLVVSAPDHHSHTETWLAEEGATRTIQFALEPIDQSVRSPAMRRAGWASLGVGLGAIAGGAVTLAFHNAGDAPLAWIRPQDVGWREGGRGSGNIGIDGDNSIGIDGDGDNSIYGDGDNSIDGDNNGNIDNNGNTL